MDKLFLCVFPLMNSCKEICLSDQMRDMVWKSDHPEKHVLLPGTDISLPFLEESVEIVCCGMQFKCNCLNQSLDTLKYFFFFF